MDPATLSAIALLGSAISGGASSYFGGKQAARDKEKDRILQQQQFDTQMNEAKQGRLFNQKISNSNLALNQKQNNRSTVDSSMNWLSALQNISQGASKPNSLDALRYL